MAFKYRLAYKAKNSIELEQVCQELINLGYKVGQDSDKDSYCICTVWREYPNQFGVQEESNGRRIIEDKDLFLALAAQHSEEDIFYKGEYIVITGETPYESSSFTKGNIYKVKGIIDNNSTILTELDNKGSTTNGWSKKYFRKATGEEIRSYIKQNKKEKMEVYEDYIVQNCNSKQMKELQTYAEGLFGRNANTVFSHEDEFRIQSSRKDYGSSVGYGNVTGYKLITFEYWKEMIKQTNMNKKITGYKLLKDLPDVKAGAIYTSRDGDTWSHDYKNNTRESNYVVEEIKNTEWFEPQYEEDKKTIIIPCEGGAFEVEISKGLMKIGLDTLNSTQVKDLIDICLIHFDGPAGWKIVPEVVSIGCKHKIQRKDLLILKQEWDKLNK